MQFDNRTDELYADYLEGDHNVVEWRYKFIPIVYFDHTNGDKFIYTIKFWVKRQNIVEWVETIPAMQMPPSDMYLYADHAAKSAGAMFRGLTRSELLMIHACLGNDAI